MRQRNAPQGRLGERDGCFVGHGAQQPCGGRDCRSRGSRYRKGFVRPRSSRSHRTVGRLGSEKPLRMPADSVTRTPFLVCIRDDTDAFARWAGRVAAIVHTQGVEVEVGSCRKAIDQLSVRSYKVAVICHGTRLGGHLRQTVEGSDYRIFTYGNLRPCDAALSFACFGAIELTQHAVPHLGYHSQFVPPCPSKPWETREEVVTCCRAFEAIVARAIVLMAEGQSLYAVQRSFRVDCQALIQVMRRRFPPSLALRHLTILLNHCRDGLIGFDTWEEIGPTGSSTG